MGKRTTIARRTAVVFGASIALLAGLVGPASAAYPMPHAVTGDVATHDPSMIRTQDGYLTYSTHNGIETRSSSDRAEFALAGSAFTTIPGWVYDYSAEGDVWAPDVSHHNGQYWMYYSASSFGSNNSAIGLATSATGQPGSWTDHGVVHATTTESDYNAIDPNLLVDSSGNWWLSFGSFWSGIRMIRLDPATGMQSSTDQTVYHLAARPDAEGALEGPAVIERNGYFYLFVSFDLCCQGTNSTYRIMVGRATSPTGPYVSRDGTPMLEGGADEILSSHDNIIGPGGQSVLADESGDLLVYHYYDGNDGGAHKLGLNYLGWDSEGWPYVDTRE